MPPEPIIIDKPVNWDDLAKSIEDGEAVLILGPDAIPLYRTSSTDNVKAVDERSIMTFSELTRHKILTDDDIKTFYYKRDNLFLFNDGDDGKRRAQKVVRECARDKTWLPDEELIKQIIAIPFSLVLNINPDEHLFNTYKEYEVKTLFDFFTTKNKTTPNFDLLNPENPLLYNLCGNATERLDSLILDYNDLFEFFQVVLTDAQTPLALRTKLQEADRFIFLGLHLEKWYFQFLIHYLNKLEKSSTNNATRCFSILCDVSEDTREFVFRQFKLECITPSRAAFEELYLACKKRKILRDLPNPHSSGTTRVLRCIEQNKFFEAFKLLEKYAHQIDPNAIILLKGRYNAWLKNQEAGIVDSRDLTTEINQIRHTLITFATQIKDEDE